VDLARRKNGFGWGLSGLAQRWGLPLVAMVSTEPYGGGEVISNDLRHYYITGDGVDPLGERTTFELDPQTREMVEVPLPPRQGLTPFTTLYVTLFLRVNPDQRTPAIPLEYLGTDDPERGGERAIVVAGPEVDVEIDGEKATGFTMYNPHNGMPGIFIED